MVYRYFIFMFVLIFPCMIDFNKIKKYYHKLRWKYHHEFKRKLYILRKESVKNSGSSPS